MIAGSTVGGKVFLHKFESREDNKQKITWLNFNKKIVHMASGKLEA